MNSIETFLESMTTGMRQAVPFVKMQALGNDFVFVHQRDIPELAATEIAALARRICDRHFGIGADGFILVRDPQDGTCQISWLYTNSDGSEAAMCGNGIRCLALYAVHFGLVGPGEFMVETAIGPVLVNYVDPQNITSDLGEPILEPSRVPVASTNKDVEAPLVANKLRTLLGDVTMTTVSMGNPHCVIFLDKLATESEMLAAAVDIQKNAQLFPAGVNVEFVVADTPESARVYVVERGCGPTLACGTAAAAVQVAGVLEGRLKRSVTIHLPGGPLLLSWSERDNHVRITGPAQIAFEGLFDWQQYATEEQM